MIGRRAGFQATEDEGLGRLKALGVAGDLMHQIAAQGQAFPKTAKSGKGVGSIGAPYSMRMPPRAIAAVSGTGWATDRIEHDAHAFNSGDCFEPRLQILFRRGDDTRRATSSKACFFSDVRVTAMGMAPTMRSGSRRGRRCWRPR